MSILDEVREQPEVVERLGRRAPDALEPLARAVRERGLAYVLVAARGSSDHAAIYAQYVLGVRNRLVVALAAPSVLSVYGAAPDMARALVVGISQSGASPDIVGVLREARRQGTVTLALTNDPASALGRTAEHVLDLEAGPERSVAATKTYTAELFAVALLSAALSRAGLGGAGDGGSSDAADELARVPDAMAEALEVDADAERVARATVGASRCVVLGRGFEYATAREWALKLKELVGIVAEPYSSADFEHGPKALVTPGFPVLIAAPLSATSAELRELVTRVANEQGGRVLAITNDPVIRSAADACLPVPSGVAEWLMPVVSIVPAQLYTYHLCVASGLDPERPAYLSKVTLTR